MSEFEIVPWNPPCYDCSMSSSLDLVWPCSCVVVVEFRSSPIVSYFFAFLLFWVPLWLVVGAKKYFFGALYKNSDEVVTQDL